MYVIKYIKDVQVPYVVKGVLRISNINMAKQFTDINTAEDFAKECGYDLEDIEIISI